MTSTECMTGHVLYLDLLNRGEISDHANPSLISVRQRGRGVEVLKIPSASDRLANAVTAYNEQAEDLGTFCALNYQRLNYATVGSLRTALKLARRNGFNINLEDDK